MKTDLDKTDNEKLAEALDRVPGYGGKRLLTEISTSRVYQHLTDDSTMAILSASTDDDVDIREDPLGNNPADRHESLRKELKQRHLPFTECNSKWIGNGGQASDERAFSVYNISLGEAVEIATMFKQKALVYKDKESCREICVWQGPGGYTRSHPDPSDPSKTIRQTYHFGETIQRFGNQGNHVLNLDDAKAIFSAGKAGSATWPTNSNRPYTLKGVYEVYLPRPSYFQTEINAIRIL